MKAVVLKMSWVELFGIRADEMTPDTRRGRWEEWKRLANEAGDSKMVEFWSDTEGCEGCRHLQPGSWCGSMGLPVTFNPILTAGHNMIGMACMGAGYEAADQQLELLTKEGGA